MCVTNGRTTTQYFNLERGARQGVPGSAYFFILMVEILFLFIIKHPEIKGIEIFEHCFLYTAYADDAMDCKPSWNIQHFVTFFQTET